MQTILKAPGNTKSKSRCNAVDQIEKIKTVRTQTDRIYATLSMKKRHGGGNDILHVGELLNGKKSKIRRPARWT